MFSNAVPIIDRRVAANSGPGTPLLECGAHGAALKPCALNSPQRSREVLPREIASWAGTALKTVLMPVVDTRPQSRPQAWRLSWAGTVHFAAEIAHARPQERFVQVHLGDRDRVPFFGLGE